MRVYIRKSSKFDHPDDMERILNYLKERGDILVKESTIEDLYYRFSEDEYCASWMSVDDRRLEEFEDWLFSIEL